MALLIGEPARQIIGVDYACTWSGVYEMLEDMQKHEGGPNNARIDNEIVRKFKETVKNVEAGIRCRKQAEKLMSKVPAMERTEKRPTRVWSDDDGELSIERFTNGEEMYWRRLKRPRRPGKTIRLMGEISATGYTTSAQIELRCSTIVALAIWLVDAGYEVEVLAADFSFNFLSGGQQSSWSSDTSYSNMRSTELGTVVIKQASEDLDVDNLAGVLCSQTFGYDILLRAIVHVCPAKANNHWGFVTQIPEEVLKALDVDVSVPRTVESEAGAQQWLEKEVERLTQHNEQLRGFTNG